MTNKALQAIRAATFAAMACAAAPAAHAVVVDNLFIPLTGTSTNTCTGEEVLFNGTIHHMSSRTVSKETAHFIIRSNERIEGTGLSSGTKYHGHGNFQLVFNFGAPDSATPPLVRNVVSSATLVSSGGSSNAVYHSRHRITIDANGRIRAEFLGGEMECRG